MIFARAVVAGQRASGALDAGKSLWRHRVFRFIEIRLVFRASVGFASRVAC